jgi:peptidyl-prolyl cis-trans isomerase A (cyclophilin A)
MYKANPKSLVLVGALSLATLFSFSSHATIVEFETSQGNFKINLHDETTPKTVENFLKYINDGDYNNTVVHRLVPDFIVQAGGYSFEGNFPLTAISTDPAVINEPIYSNVRGTVAMAKVGGNANSATSQWFINYKDNSANLDAQNGGFTVFGEIIEGMDVLDSLTSLTLCQEIPMPDYTNSQCADSSFVPGVENFVTISSVNITDTTIVTDGNLASVKNTSLNNEEASDSGGGSLSYFTLCLLSFFGCRRIIRNK